MWPEESRKQVKLGTLAVTKIEDNAKCDTGIFDPTQLADGIAGPEEDPLFAIRSPAYAVSFSRRTQ
jgi:catalase